jgi:ABC-type branched-subunit amino acid transport system ATPase component
MTMLSVEACAPGYGKIEVLHEVSIELRRGRSSR